MDWQGKKLGNYQVQRLLGSGGFADVYLGKHIYLNTSAAIKVLQAHLGENDLQAFYAEARTVAGLTHPHIIRVLEFGVEEQTPYLVMDYAPAGTLRQLHPRPTRLTLNECAAYIKQVASALQYAHDQHVIHRDVKPENMLIGPNGQILLSDFGIAVVAQSSRYQGQQDFGGTVAYSSPEQIQGRATYASDQYALGILLYEWLAGELPFRGTFVEIGSQHLFTLPPSLLNKILSLSPIVEQIYQKAVAKEPQQRFARIEDFALALEVASQGNDPTAIILRSISPSGAISFPTTMNSLSPTPLASTMPAATQPVPFLPSGAGIAQPPPPLLAPTVSPYPPSMRRNKRNPTAVVFIAILLVLLIATGIWGYTRQDQSTTSKQNLSSSRITSTPNGGNSSKTTPPIAAPTATPQPSATASDSVIQENKLLTCGNCNDPMHIRINTIAIQTGNGRMVWDITITNVSGDIDNIEFTNFSLHDPLSASQIEASGVQASGYSLSAGDNTEASFIFTFVPYHQVSYTLNVECSDLSGIDVKFAPVNFTF